MILPSAVIAKSRIISPQVKSLQVTVNQDWMAPAVMRLGSEDILNVSFDELSHTYHRYKYSIEHCEADWSSSVDLFESDWLEGFNDITIEDYENSINTTVAYTHYQFQIPNERCLLKMSGNYRIRIIDEDQGNEEVLVAEFMVVEQMVNLSLNVTTNTDIDVNHSHQQISMSLSYRNLTVTNPEEQIWTVVTQNERQDNQKQHVKPDFINLNGLEWTHNPNLIFDAGNEYHKFEVLDVGHPTMGIDFIHWDGTYYQAFPFVDEPRPNYIFDKDANGSFCLRNSDNYENETTSDYVWINYRLKAPLLPEGSVVIDGKWTTDENSYNYMMEYDEQSATYLARILQKQGYYSYQYLWEKNGSTYPLPSEGNFYQTENVYHAYVYYKGTGERTWRLVGYCRRNSSGV